MSARHLPLFMRIFLVTLAAIGIVQATSFAFVILAGPPSEAFRTVNEVADVLRRGPGQYSGFAVDLRSEQPLGEPAGPFALALARRLRLPAGHVTVVHHQFGPPLRLGSFGGTPTRDVNSEVLLGRFEAAIAQRDGRWLVATALRRKFEAWQRDALIWLLATTLIALPFAWLLARWSAAPVKALAHAAENIGRDERAPPLTLSGPREVSDAARTFNAMQARIRRQLNDRTILIGAIAHDLRTPMARLVLRLRDLPEDIRAPISRDVADMEAMIDAALEFVAAETKQIERRLLDFRSLVETVVDDFADSGAAVEALSGPPARLHGNPVALRALVTNLVTNGVRYGGSATLSIRSDAMFHTLEVEDHGPGFSPVDLEQVFEPFYRGEASRSRETGGSGLGLAAVRAVARAHGGDAWASNRVEGGALVSVSLPHAPPVPGP